MQGEAPGSTKHHHHHPTKLSHPVPLPCRQQVPRPEPVRTCQVGLDCGRDLQLPHIEVQGRQAQRQQLQEVQAHGQSHQADRNGQPVANLRAGRRR